MTKKEQAKLKRTAYHEAGHAVGAFVMSKRFKKVSIIPNPDGESLGRLSGCVWNSKLNPEFDGGARLRHLVEAQIIIFLAGPVAEAKLTGRYMCRCSPAFTVTAIWRRRLKLTYFISALRSYDLPLFPPPIHRLDAPEQFGLGHVPAVALVMDGILEGLVLVLEGFLHWARVAVHHLLLWCAHSRPARSPRPACSRPSPRPLPVAPWRLTIRRPGSKEEYQYPMGKPPSPGRPPSPLATSPQPHGLPRSLPAPPRPASGAWPHVPLFPAQEANPETGTPTPLSYMLRAHPTSKFRFIPFTIPGETPAWNTPL